jgi:hypothetical protein
MGIGHAPRAGRASCTPEKEEEGERARSIPGNLAAINGLICTACGLYYHSHCVLLESEIMLYGYKCEHALFLLGLGLFIVPIE